MVKTPAHLYAQGAHQTCLQLLYDAHSTRYLPAACLSTSIALGNQCQCEGWCAVQGCLGWPPKDDAFLPSPPPQQLYNKAKHSENNLLTSMPKVPPKRASSSCMLPSPADTCLLPTPA
jgi:hypothetical protein